MEDRGTQTTIWGLRKPQTREEEQDYHDDLRGAVIDLIELGFRVYALKTYRRPILFIGGRSQ